jgi:hypothetical protein
MRDVEGWGLPSNHGRGLECIFVHLLGGLEKDREHART